MTWFVLRESYTYLTVLHSGRPARLIHLRTASWRFNDRELGGFNRIIDSLPGRDAGYEVFVLDEDG